MNQCNTYAALFTCLVALLVGCATQGPSADTKDGGYRTIPAEIGRDSVKAKALTLQATDALENDDLETAERLLRDALTADVMHGPAHNNLGQIYFRQQRYYEAAWEFQYAIRLMPHQPIPRNNLGLVFEATGKLTDAAKQYELAVEEEPDNPVLLGNLARAKIRLGENSPELRELLQQIVLKDTRPEWRGWARQQLHLMLTQ